jgi:hypothetical protein|tara:strand:- start:3364 stop:3507 length:144 start_codon:yes stop_codon:yes gene_type:complete
MPYSIVKRDGEFCVRKTEGDKRIIACHKTEDDAYAQMRALYAAEADK